MKYHGWVLSMISAFIAGALVRSHATHAPAQVDVSRMVTVEYVKVKPGQREDYVRVERNLSKPVYDLLLKEKKVLSWSLYEVRPQFSIQTSSADYDFVTYIVHDGAREFSKVSGLWSPGGFFGSAIATAHPDKTLGGD